MNSTGERRGGVAYFGDRGQALSDLMSLCVLCVLPFLLFMNPLLRCRRFVNLPAVMDGRYIWHNLQFCEV